MCPNCFAKLERIADCLHHYHEGNGGPDALAAARCLWENFENEGDFPEYFIEGGPEVAVWLVLLVQKLFIILLHEWQGGDCPSKEVMDVNYKKLVECDLVAYDPRFFRKQQGQVLKVNLN